MISFAITGPLRLIDPETWIIKSKKSYRSVIVIRAHLSRVCLQSCFILKKKKKKNSLSFVDALTQVYSILASQQKSFLLSREETLFFFCLLLVEISRSDTLKRTQFCIKTGSCVYSNHEKPIYVPHLQPS